MRRSIEYRIIQEAEKTRALILKNNNSAQIDQILEEGSIHDLPKTDLTSFLQFEPDLKRDVDLVKKLVRIILESA